MSDTEPGSRVMPGSTSDSCVPGASSGVSAAVRVRNQPTPPPTAPTSRTASSASAESRTERSRSRSFLRPLGVDDDRAGLVLRLLVVDRGRAEAGRGVGVAPRVAAGVGLPPRAGGGAPPARAAAGRVLQPALPGRGRAERAEQRPRRAAAGPGRGGGGRTVVGEAAVDRRRAAEGGLLAGRRARARPPAAGPSRSGTSPNGPVGARRAGEDPVGGVGRPVGRGVRPDSVPRSSGVRQGVPPGPLRASP